MEMKLGFMIQKLCKEQGLTIAELSRRSGVPKQTIHNWIIGQKSVNPIQMHKISKEFRVTLYFLLFGLNEHNKEI